MISRRAEEVIFATSSGAGGVGDAGFFHWFDAVRGSVRRRPGWCRTISRMPTVLDRTSRVIASRQPKSCFWPLIGGVILSTHIRGAVVWKGLRTPKCAIGPRHSMGLPYMYTLGLVLWGGIYGSPMECLGDAIFYSREQLLYEPQICCPTS